MQKRLSNWGNFPVVVSEEHTFTQEEQLRTFVLANSHMIARGNGRCYGDASLAKHTLSMIKYDKIISFDKTLGILETQSGITLDQILAIIVPEGWFLPVTPGTKYITIGGAVAADVHGKNHHIEGTFSSHIIDIDVLTGQGTIICCSASQHTDLFWATCGGMGLTGVITRVKFQLRSIRTAYIKQTQLKARNLEEVIDLFYKYNQHTYAMAWIDCLQRGKAFGRSILILGEHANPEELNLQQRKAPLSLPEKQKLTIPFNLPSFVLNTFTVKAFNWLYYNKHYKQEMHNIVPYEPFFYPLDAILHWNRGYGKAGFVQYQFVLPLKNKEGLIAILQRISDKGWGSFLAVLKVFGKQDNLISFPMEGYTLALDFPVRKGLLAFLDELDRIVLHYGGRLYLSKDARMKPDMFWNSYPQANKFAAIIQQYNPKEQFVSMQSNRLLLTK